MFNQKFNDLKVKAQNFWNDHKESIIVFGVGVAVGVIADEIRYSKPPIERNMGDGYSALITDRDGLHAETWIFDQDGKRVTINVAKPSIPLSDTLISTFTEENRNE